MSISEFYKGKTVLVTGAGGSIGSALVDELLRNDAKVVAFDISELALYNLGQKHPGVKLVLGDVSNSEDVKRAFVGRINIVFHAAAYKHVRFCEENASAAWRVNAGGTLTMIQGAKEHGVEKFVLISTDKAVNAVCIMGRTKRAAEAYTRIATHTVVRLGNVLNSSGSVVPWWRDQIAGGKPVTITDGRVTRYFITLGAAARRILQAGEISTGGETFVPDMGQPQSLFEVAQHMGATAFKFIGLQPGEKLHEELYVGKKLPTEYGALFRDTMEPPAGYEDEKAA